MGLPRLSYTIPTSPVTTKTIDFPVAPWKLQILPAPPRTVQTTLTGVDEVITIPRVDIQVLADWRGLESRSLRRQLDNFLQWGLQGNAWTLALDSAKVVNTTLAAHSPTAPYAVGATVVTVVSATGITQGGQYKIISGPNYQLIEVVSISGSDITITPSLDAAMAEGAIFRDQLFFPGVLRESGSPIHDHDVPDSYSVAALPQIRFDFNLSFIETVA